MTSSRITKICTCILWICVFSASSWAQDPGIPDTVRLSATSAVVGTGVSMPVSLYNDQDLTSIVIPLVIDGYSGWIRFDSVSYLGGRLSEPSILDAREGYVFATDTFTVDSLVLRFMVSFGTTLPAGDGKICDIWFTPRFGGDVAIDSLPVSPYGGLRLTTAARAEFTPQFQPGAVNIACDYIVGNVRYDDYAVNITDHLGFEKGYYGCFPLGNGPDCYADVNCDRHTDMRDDIILLKYLFQSGNLCQCGTYSPAWYVDPGAPDTVWVGYDTLYVGVESMVDISIINDEPIAGFALSLEWDGSAILGFDSYWGQESITPRSSGLTLEDYECHGADNVNPDTLYIATFFPLINGIIEPGSGAVFRAPFKPVSPGTATFRLIPYRSGAGSMLVTEAGAAIEPVVVGNITVLPRPCGDANGDGEVSLADAVYLINHIFLYGPPPTPACLGDANHDDAINIADAVYLVNFVFKGGPAPVANCCP